MLRMSGWGWFLTPVAFGSLETSRAHAPMTFVPVCGKSRQPSPSSARYYAGDVG
jgi:hypothetical protein